MRVILTCDKVWVWVAIPFPVSDPYTDDPFPDIPTWPKRPKGGENGTRNDEGDTGDLPLDVNFFFFLFW
jgi:hypothetical protein